MRTQATAYLRAQLISLGHAERAFCDAFHAWKSSFPSGEYSSPLFGKDGAYTSPKLQGGDLRHVHLAPVADQAALARWLTQHRRRGRKVSDRVLVYASSDYSGHLLIAILDEPGAHDIARMATPEDAQIMRRLARIADDFLCFGKVIA